MARALLRILSRRKLSQWPSSSSPRVLTRPSSSDSTLLLARSFHRQVFLFEDRKKTPFAQQPLGFSSSVVLLSRHIYSSSSEPEKSSIKIDAFGDFPPKKSVEAVEESSIKIDAFGDVVPEKSVEEMVTSIDGWNWVHYVINAIHDLTCFNWSISVVLTALLMRGLMYPFSREIQRRALELKNSGMSIQKMRRVMKTRDTVDMLRLQEFGKWCWYYLNLWQCHLTITMIFINGINSMAKKIPGFTDLSALDRFYMLPIVTGLAFWLNRTMTLPKILSRMKELPLYCIFFTVVQAAYKYEPAVCFYLIPYRISLYILHLMCRSKQIADLRKSLGVLLVTVSDQHKIMAVVISFTREFFGMVKKKTDKK